MSSDATDRQQKLNKLLANRGSLAERAKIARELDDDSLMLAASHSPQAQRELERRRHERLLASDKKLTVVTFQSYAQLPITRDGLDFKIEFAVVDSNLRGSPEEKSLTIHGRILVGMSRTLESVWALQPADRDKVLLEFAKRHIQEKVQDGTLTDHEELQLTTANSPTSCPFDPDRIFVEIGRPMEFPVEDTNPVEAAQPSSVAARIVDARDNVNAIFHDRHGEDLLALPRERALLELFRPCHSQEEFGYRVSALGGLAGAISAKALAKHFAGDSTMMRPIQTLREYVTKAHGVELARTICDPLSHLNRLRQMYPIHTDDADRIMKAHSFFGLEYPIREWPYAWGVLLESYAQALESLLKAVKHG